MSTRVPLDRNERRKRKRELIAIAILSVAFVVLTVLEFRLSNLSSTLPFVNSIFFFGLLNINLIILVALCWLIFRNIGKLFIERRRKVLGSKLKTKLVVTFLGFSVIPTLVLFLISASYINSSFDKWFSIKIQNTFQASLEITRTLYRTADEGAMHFADQLTRGIAPQITRGLNAPGSSDLIRYMEDQRELFALDAVEFYPDVLEDRLISQRTERAGGLVRYPRMPLDLLNKAFDGEKVSQTQHLGSGDLIRCLSPVKGTHGEVLGVIGVATYIPVSLVNKVDEIASVLDDYKDINPLKYPMKSTYFVILIMITLVILFVAIWIGLYMAKELTDPVQRLVAGAQAVGAGNLDYAIQGAGHDEISVLVDQFNKMTKDLKENRKRLTEATGDLERRRLQLEAILANVGTGVLVVERSGVVTTLNRAASQLLGLAPAEVLDRRYTDILSAEAAPLKEVILRALESRIDLSLESPELTQWSYRHRDVTRSLAAIATPLQESTTSAPWGVVVVIDDMTVLIKGQREMAWREVARRIAHEIKNPLTPIKLSAQRLQRRMGDYRGKDAELLKECTDTIIRHTDELKEMVNEFSNFARFPEISPAPHDLNAPLKEVISLYEQAHPQIEWVFEPESKLPVFSFDRDQIKRVMINLLDNAVAALRSHRSPSSDAPEIKVETHFNSELQMAVIIVKDNGPGITEEVRARLFEPYFSTKDEGTGLGLAIAKRIINDHDGFIRVHSVPGEGTQFLIELPTALRGGPIAFGPDHR